MEKIKSFFSKKNMITIVVTFIVAIISTVNFSIAIYSNNKSEVIVNLKNGDIINRIILSKNSLNFNEFADENLILEKIGETENRLITINDTNIKLEMSVIDDISIDFGLKNGEIEYDLNGYNYKINGNNLSIYNSKIDIIKNSITYKSIVIFILSFVVLGFMIILIENILKKISEDKIKILDIVLFFISTFVIYLSNIYLFMMINKILAIIPALCLIIYILIYFKASIKEWKDIFLCISAVFGVMMIFIITPGNVPDEPSHYTRSYIDSVAFFKADKDSAKMPLDVGLFFDKFTHDVHSLEIKYSGKSYITELTKNNNYTEVSSTTPSYENTKYLSFLPYLPSTVMCFIGRISKLPVLITFLLCRLINLIICVVLCYYAIKSTPKFKKIFALVATFPIFMQQAIGINMDFLTNSVVFLFIALIFKYRFGDSKILLKDLVLLSVTGIALGLCKFGYFPILALVFLIPKEKFYNKKIATVFEIILILIPFIISLLVNMTTVNHNSENNVDVFTIKEVICNPINSAKICIKTFVYRFAADSFCGLINGFGWSTKYQLEISLWTIGAIYIILLFSDNEDCKDLKLKDRIVMLAVWAFICLILYGVAFLWTNINADMVNGLQARYFIPILPLFYIAISNNFLKVNVKNKWSFYTILMFISHIMSILSILVTFY